MCVRMCSDEYACVCVLADTEDRVHARAVDTTAIPRQGQGPQARTLMCENKQTHTHTPDEGSAIRLTARPL